MATFLHWCPLRWLRDRKKEGIFLFDDRHNPLIPSTVTLNIVVSGGIVVEVKNTTTDISALTKLTDSLKKPTEDLQAAESAHPVPTT